VAHALAFVLGFTLVFTALGASVGLIGYAARDLLPYLQKPAA
jgi:cytochrome c biogenesis protein CcdA